MFYPPFLRFISIFSPVDKTIVAKLLFADSIGVRIEFHAPTGSGS